MCKFTYELSLDIYFPETKKCIIMVHGSGGLKLKAGITLGLKRQILKKHGPHSELAMPDPVRFINSLVTCDHSPEGNCPVDRTRVSW